MSEPNKQISMYLPYSLWEELQRFCQEESVNQDRKVTVSETFRVAARKYMRDVREARQQKQ